MQLSSLVLSATALLVQAASGAFLLYVSDSAGAGAIDGYAGLMPHPDFSHVGFYGGGERAEISIEGPELRLGGGFKFKNVGDAEYMMVARDSSGDSPADLVQPFAPASPQHFRYEGDLLGEGGGIWSLCEGPWGFDIYLSAGPVTTRDGCVHDVTLGIETIS